MHPKRRYILSDILHTCQPTGRGRCRPCRKLHQIGRVGRKGLHCQQCSCTPQQSLSTQHGAKQPKHATRGKAAWASSTGAVQRDITVEPEQRRGQHTKYRERLGMHACERTACLKEPTALHKMVCGHKQRRAQEAPCEGSCTSWPFDLAQAVQTNSAYQCRGRRFCNRSR